MDESDMEIGETTPTKHPLVFVPETPSPVFSRMAHKKDLITSPSKRKYWFENVHEGKIGAELNKNDRLQIHVAEYDNKKIAFDRLKKIRQKKSSKNSLYNHKNETSNSSNGARPQDIWPSDSDSDSPSNSNTSSDLLYNGSRKIQQTSPVNQPVRSRFDPMTSAVSTPPDSPVPPLRKRIRLGLSRKHSETFDLLNTPPVRESTASIPYSSYSHSSSSSHSNKHHRSKSKQRKLTDTLKSSLSDFVSARSFFNCNDHSRPEAATCTSVGSVSSSTDSRIETHPNSDTRDSKPDRRKEKKDNKPNLGKSVLERLKSMSRRSNFESVDMELTPPFSVGNVQSDFNASVNLSALPAKSFYNKSPVKKRTSADPGSRESATTSSSESERRSRKPSKSRSKPPATSTTPQIANSICFTIFSANEVFDVESDDDAVVVVNQLESDETMAKRLQEEMDHEFALTIASSHTPSHSSAGVGSHTHQRVARGRATVSQGFGVSMFPGLGTDEDDHIPDFPFMVTGNWDQSPLALLTSHVALLGNSTRWTSPTRYHRPRGRGSHGRTGRRNAVFGVNSPGGDGEDYEALLELAESIGDVKPKGLTKTEINRLPVKKFVPSDSSQNKECLVCMCEFEKKENIRILTCFHDFHAKCIDKWLKGNRTCPICRVEVEMS